MALFPGKSMLSVVLADLNVLLQLSAAVFARPEKLKPGADLGNWWGLCSSHRLNQLKFPPKTPGNFMERVGRIS